VDVAGAIQAGPEARLTRVSFSILYIFELAEDFLLGI